MNFYNENLECLKIKSLELYEKIKKFYEKGISEVKFENEKKSIKHLDKICSVDTREENKALVIQCESKEYRLNSIYRPGAEAEKWTNQYVFNNIDSVITVLGFGNGIFIRELMRRKGETDSIVIREPSPELFLHAMENYDIKDIINAPRVYITVEGLNEFEFRFILMQLLNLSNLKNQITCILPQYDDIFTETCVSFMKDVNEASRLVKINVNTIMYFGAKYISNVLKNSKYIGECSELMDYKQLADEVPAIIVSAGPSVKDNLQALRNAKGKAVIFAVDRIIDYLLDNGVEPDFVATIDPSKPMDCFSRRDDLNMPLLCMFESRCEILEKHKGKKVIYHSRPFIESIYHELKKSIPALATGNGIGTAVFSACLKLGFEKIILVGQDLAYDKEYTHAGEIAETEREGSAADIMVEGIDGEMVASRVDWSLFIAWFKDNIKINTHIKVIDAKIKGAKIQGAENMPLQEAIDKYCVKDVDVQSIIESVGNTFNKEEMVKVRKFFKDNCEKIDIIKEKTEMAIKLSKKQIKAYERNENNTNSFQRNHKRITKVGNYIEKQPNYLLSETLITALEATHLSELYQFTNNQKEDTIRTYEKTICIYKAIIRAMEFIEPLLKDASDELQKEETN